MRNYIVTGLWLAMTLAGRADVPTPDFSYVAEPGQSPTGWISKFGGDVSANTDHFRIAPDSNLCYAVNCNYRPWVGVGDARSNYTAAIYADISSVQRNKTGRFIFELGWRNQISQGLMMDVSGNVVLYQANGSTITHNSVKTEAPPSAGFHLFAWTQSTTAGATLYIDGTRVGCAATMTNAVSQGFQIGNLLGSVWNSNYAMAEGMAVAATLAWDQVLDDAQQAELAVQYPALAKGVLMNPSVMPADGYLRLTDGDTVAAGEFAGVVNVNDDAAVNILYDGELTAGKALLKAKNLIVGTKVSWLVNGKSVPGALEAQVRGNAVVLWKRGADISLNAMAVRDGESIKVSSNVGVDLARKSFDGDGATYFQPTDDANNAGVSWTGIEFEEPVLVSRIKYASAVPKQMVGGAFQGANAVDFSDAENFYVPTVALEGTNEVELTEARGPYKYLRFMAYCGGNASEIAFFGLTNGVKSGVAPQVLASWSTNGIPGFVIQSTAEEPQMLRIQRAMARYCEDDDYDTFVSHVAEPGEAFRWEDVSARRYSKYRVQGVTTKGASEWVEFEIAPETLIDGAESPTFGGDLPGFYDTQAKVSIEYPVPGAKIHYTTDGSTPTTNSSVFSGEIQLNDVCSRENDLSNIRTSPTECQSIKYCAWNQPSAKQPKVNVIRARAFLPDGSASTNEVAGTWLVGSVAGQHQLKVVSVQTDRANYFGDDIGIMVPGDIYYAKGFNDSSLVGRYNANYFQTGDEWERPARVEIFETNRTTLLSAEIGTRVHGNFSRAYCKKSLSFYLRKEYGLKNARIQLFSDEGAKKFKRFLLRNGGSDWPYCCMRDAVGQGVFRGHVKTMTQGYEPCVLYINGEYWGLYNIRHRYTKHHFEEWGDGVGDDVDFFKLPFEVQEGDVCELKNIMRFLISHTSGGVLSDADLQTVEEQVDIDDMIDSHIICIFLASTDWLANNNNAGFWRNRTGDNRRWKFLAYDCDCSAGGDWGGAATYNSLSATLNIDDSNEVAGKFTPTFLKRCMKNQGFKRRFANRYADLLNTILLAKNTTNRVAQAAAKIEHEIPRCAARWTNMGSLSVWKSKVATFEKFFVERPAYAWSHLKSACSSGQLVSITLAAPEGEGTVKINSLSSGEDFTLPFSAQYFSDIPVKVTAIPTAGQKFVGWKIGETVVSSSAEYEFNPSAGLTLKAVFTEDGSRYGTLISGEYAGGTNIAVTADSRFVLKDARFGGTITFTGKGNVTLHLLEGTENAAAAIACDQDLAFEGEGALSLVGAAGLIAAGGDVVVSNGVIALEMAATEEKSAAVMMKGNYLQYGGKVTLKLTGGAQAYGFRWKDVKNVEAEISGGEFVAEVGCGTNSVAFKMNKGSNDFTLTGDARLTGTLTAVEGSIVETAGNIKFKKKANVEVAAKKSATEARVFKSEKKVAVSGDAVVLVEAKGEGSEIFSSDALIEISGGVTQLTASDDCLSAGTDIVITDGKLQALSTAGDAIDSNGAVVISNGYVFATTCSAAHEGIDVDGDGAGSGTWEIAGGTVVAVGGKGLLRMPDVCEVECCTNACIEQLQKYLVLTSQYDDRVEKLSVNLESGEKRNAVGFALFAAVPKLVGGYGESDTKPSKDSPAGVKLDENIDGVFVTTIAGASVPGAVIELAAEEEHAAKAEAEAREIVLTGEDVAAGMEATCLRMVAQAFTNGSGKVKYRAVVAVNPEVVDAPAVANGGDDPAEPIKVVADEGGVEVELGVTNAVKGLWYGYEVSDSLILPFVNDLPSFSRATGKAHKVKGSKRESDTGFYRVKVMAARPIE